MTRGRAKTKGGKEKSQTGQRTGRWGPALGAGLMGEADVDVALQRVMGMRMNLGMFDPASEVPYTSIGDEVLNSAHGQALALDAARESIILLQNNGSTLPLRPPAGGTVALIGPIATDAKVMMGGKSARPPPTARARALCCCRPAG